MNPLGIDIGGANLKGASVDGSALSISFPLWKHPERLAEQLHQLITHFPQVDRLAITMTGELCDCFATKRQGVHHILDAVESIADGREVLVWLTDGRFCSLHQARQQPIVAAASNWLALATFVARLVPDGSALLIDVGSTTTDLIAYHHGLPIPNGRTDVDRLRERELIYMGVRRTPICAFTLSRPTCAEFFATTHDVSLLLGMVPEDPDDLDTADGRPATRTDAHARLARMLGADVESFSWDETISFANEIHSHQQAILAQGIRRRCETCPEPVRTVILSGSGEFLSRAVVEPLGFDIVSVTDTWGHPVSVSACAFALAHLASERGTTDV